jgi:hypothetical protein
MVQNTSAVLEYMGEMNNTLCFKSSRMVAVQNTKEVNAADCAILSPLIDLDVTSDSYMLLEDNIVHYCYYDVDTNFGSMVELDLNSPEGKTTIAQFNKTYAVIPSYSMFVGGCMFFSGTKNPLGEVILQVDLLDDDEELSNIWYFLGKAISSDVFIVSNENTFLFVESYSATVKVRHDSTGMVPLYAVCTAYDSDDRWSGMIGKYFYTWVDDNIMEYEVPALRLLRTWYIGEPECHAFFTSHFAPQCLFTICDDSGMSAHFLILIVKMLST